MRQKELDISKGIGIILMVIGHMHLNESIVNHFIYAFHMPLFFIISGMLYKRKPIASAMKSKARSLIIPYLVFGACYSLITIIIGLVRKDNSVVLPAIKTFLLYPADNFQIESALWFLPAMFITGIMYCCLDILIKDKRILTVAVTVIGAFGFLIPSLLDFRLFWCLDVSFAALFFYHIGVLISRFDLINKYFKLKESSKPVFWSGLFIAAAVGTALIFINDTVNMRQMKWGIVPLTIINAIAATLVLIIISKYISGTKLNESVVIKWMCGISITSIVYLCTNHPCIRGTTFAVKRTFSLVKLSNVYIIKITALILTFAVLFILSKLTCNTPLRIIIGRKKGINS